MPRALLVRNDVGAAAHIIQPCDALISRVFVERSCLILVLKGRKTLRWEGDSLVLDSGQAAVIAGGRLIDFHNQPDPSGPYEARWIIFDEKLLSSHPRDESLTTVETAAAIPLVETEFRKAFEEALRALEKPETEIPTAIASARVIELLLWIGLHGFRLPACTTQTLTQRILGMIEHSLADGWTAPLVADRLAMSEATLRRHLAREGQSFSKLIQDARLSQALNLIQATDLPIEHIARDLGYASASRFAVRFRLRFGHPPSVLRGHKRDRDCFSTEMDRPGAVSRP